MSIVFKYKKQIKESVIPQNKIIFNYKEPLTEAKLLEAEDLDLDLDKSADVNDAAQMNKDNTELSLDGQKIKIKALTSEIKSIVKTLNEKYEDLVASVLQEIKKDTTITDFEQEVRKRIQSEPKCAEVATKFEELQDAANKLEQDITSTLNRLTEPEMSALKKAPLSNVVDQFKQINQNILSVEPEAGNDQKLDAAKQILSTVAKELNNTIEELNNSISIAKTTKKQQKEINRTLNDSDSIGQAIREIYQNKTNQIPQNVAKLFNGVGFKDEVEKFGSTIAENPCLEYLKKLKQSNRITLLDDGKYAAIHNAFANNWISVSDYRATASDTVKLLTSCGILYKTSLLNKNAWQISDILAQYSLLTQKIDAITLNPEGKAGAVHAGITIPDAGEKLSDAFAYKLMFDDTGEIRTADEIKNLINYFIGDGSLSRRKIIKNPDKNIKAVRQELSANLNVAEDKLKGNPILLRLIGILLIKAYVSGIFKTKDEMKEIKDACGIADTQLSVTADGDTNEMLTYFNLDGNMNKQWVSDFAKAVKSIYDGA